jgi:hypothetical protein
LNLFVSSRVIREFKEKRFEERTTILVNVPEAGIEISNK